MDDHRSRNLWSDPTRTRFFLISDELVLPVGDFEIRTVTGRRQDVDVEGVAAFEVTREEAREWLDDQLDVVLERVKSSVMTMLDRYWARARA